MQELVLIQPGGTLRSESARETAQAETRREFEERLAECGPLAYRVARGVLRNSADAEDVAQEALLRAYRSFHRLRDRNRFRAWLVRISFRIALDRLRSVEAPRPTRHPLVPARAPAARAPPPKTSQPPANFSCTSIAPSPSFRKNFASPFCSPPWMATPSTKSLRSSPFPSVPSSPGFLSPENS